MAEALLSLVAEALKTKGLAYTVFECDPKLADTAAFCERYGFALEQSANTIIVVGKGEPKRYAACVVLANARLDVNKKVRELMGVKKASFAAMDEALALIGMEYGGVTAFGLPADMPIYVDAAVMDQSEIVMGGGNRSSKVLLQPAELRKLPGVQVVKGLAKAKEVQ